MVHRTKALRAGAQLFHGSPIGEGSVSMPFVPRHRSFFSRSQRVAALFALNPSLKEDTRLRGFTGSGWLLEYRVISPLRLIRFADWPEAESLFETDDDEPDLSESTAAMADLLCRWGTYDGWIVDDPWYITGSDSGDDDVMLCDPPSCLKLVRASVLRSA
jgi:hypothetical protein